MVRSTVPSGISPENFVLTNFLNILGIQSEKRPRWSDGIPLFSIVVCAVETGGELAIAAFAYKNERIKMRNISMSIVYGQLIARKNQQINL